MSIILHRNQKMWAKIHQITQQNMIYTTYILLKIMFLAFVDLIKGLKKGKPLMLLLYRVNRSVKNG